MNENEARSLSAGLLYIESFDAGFTRRRCGKGFKFLDSNGRLITSKNIRQRCLDLVIPPAWNEIWISPNENGHIQATGVDDAGRKQYIYHPRWHEASSVHKYGRLLDFADVLPIIRRRVRKDLNKASLDKHRVIAAVVRLLDKACIRIGNKQYLQANDSRGATTLTSDHVSTNNEEIVFNFRGKSGKDIELTFRDEELAKVIAESEVSDAEFLFSYINSNEELVPVTSIDVNTYLLETTDQNITAKDFRTWRGSVTAFSMLLLMKDNLNKTAKKRFILEAVKTAAEILKNTPAVCRKSYIHSAILKAAEEGILPSIVQKLDSSKYKRANLTQKEAHLVAFLEYVQENSLVDNIEQRRSAA